jgi:hypothetical protein
MTRRFEIEVDRIVLDGLAPASREAIANAIRRQLEVLLAAEGAASAAAPRSDGAAAIGAAVARAVHARLPRDPGARS